nr:probable serine/threonine-protein kinase pats1 [Lytechinus pictus]
MADISSLEDELRSCCTQTQWLQNSLLSKGLKFCPTPPEVEQIALSQDLSTFYRRIRLKEFCLDAPPSDPEPFYKKSTWIPPKNRVPSLETYIQAVSSQVRSTDTLDTRAHDNLPREERNTESDNGNGKYDKIARDITEQVIKVESSVPNTTYSIWDFGGQEIYYVTHPLFLSWRALYILVIPLHLQLSDEAPRTEDLTDLIGSTVRTHRTILELIHFWLMSVYTHAVPDNQNPGGNPNPGGNTKVLLIGTFAGEGDTRISKDEVKSKENELKKLIESQPYREQVLLKIFEFDNRHAQMKEVKEVQDRIDASIKEAPYMTDKFPVKWNTFLCEIEGNGKDTWTVKEALSTMQKSWGIKDKDELQNMLQWCHDTGHIIYHQGCDLIVLKPQFLNSIVSNIITVVDSEKMRGKLSEHYKELCKKGILHIDIIKDVWNEHKGEDAQLEDIINMMIKFDLICEIPDTKDGVSCDDM